MIRLYAQHTRKYTAVRMAVDETASGCASGDLRSLTRDGPRETMMSSQKVFFIYSQHQSSRRKASISSNGLIQTNSQSKSLFKTSIENDVQISKKVLK
jgi:hypothetical protein